MPFGDAQCVCGGPHYHQDEVDRMLATAWGLGYAADRPFPRTEPIDEDWAREMGAVTCHPTPNPYRAAPAEPIRTETEEE